MTEPDPEIESYHLKEAFGRPRTYATVEEALARFRTVPPQDHYLDYVIDHVGAAVAEAGRRRLAVEVRPAHLRAVRRRACARIALPYLPRMSAAASPCCAPRTAWSPRTSAASMYEQLGRVAPVIEIPEAGHHAMLDQPLILLTALRSPARRLGPLRAPAPLAPSFWHRIPGSGHGNQGPEATVPGPTSPAQMST